jgi:hypothetical protein
LYFENWKTKKGETAQETPHWNRKKKKIPLKTDAVRTDTNRLIVFRTENERIVT